MDPALAKEVAMLSKMRVIDEAIERGDSEVQQLYKDSTVLVSGGTGFMGKQMIEKLFRTCDIKKVFLLMRPKKNKPFHERLGLLLTDPVFDTVKKIKPGFEKRICPIDADVAEPRLGISDEDLATITAETEIIIHGAATVNFNEPLRVAVNTNVRGTVEMLKIGKQCPKLKSYVHISTAFSHATAGRIEKDLSETFYKSPMSPRVAIEMANTIDDQKLNDITPKLIQDWPNTYTFTKAIAEEACREVADGLPISIVRPAIVIASYLEPSPGYLDRSCVFGPSGFVVGVGLGLMHTFQCDLEKKIDLVPVDLVNNAIIAAAWLTVKRRSEGDFSSKIYTVTSIRNGIKWRSVFEIFRNEVLPKFPSPLAAYAIFVTVTASNILYFLLSWLWHYIPGYIIDTVLTIIGKKPMAVKLYTKMAVHTKVLSYFTTNMWLMKDNNLQEMYASFNTTDKLIFNCNISNVKWEEIVVSWALGCRKYIVRDKLQGSAEALKKQFWLKMLHYFIVCPIYFFSLYKMASLAYTFLSFVISTVMCIF